MAQVVLRLLQELRGRGRCLEIGVGTGRIALPLHRAGIPMVGVDLSRPMMNVLVQKAGGRPGFPLIQADATRLPIRDAGVGSALASHVFHLIPDWRGALAELLRVVRPAGVLLISSGTRQQGSMRQELREHVERLTGSETRDPGANHGSGEVEAALLAAGAGERRLPPVRVTRTTTVGALIDEIEAGQSSWTWSIPRSRLQEAAEKAREWAARRFGPLDAPHSIEAQVEWQAFDLP
jgi:SAM-dependent methyltransferase